MTRRTGAVLRHRFRGAGGVRLVFRSFGGPVGAPRVLILPGFWRSGLSPRMRLLARHLADRYRPLILDFRGHGTSGGLFRFGGNEVEDVALLLDRLRDEDRAPLGLIGFSIGGTLGVCAMGRDPFRHSSVASVATISSPLDAGRLPLPVPDPRLLAHVRLAEVWRIPFALPPAMVEGRPEPLALVGKLAPVPLLVVHARGDWLVPAEHAEALYEAASPPKAYRLVENRRRCHADSLLLFQPEETLEILDTWLETTLPTERKRPVAAPAV